MRSRVAIASGGSLLVVLDIVATATSRHAEFSAATLTMALVTGVIYIATGLIAATRRPESRVGLLLCITGLVILASLLSQSNQALLYTIGLICFWIPPAILTHIVLTFPTGRIRSWTEWVLIVAAYSAALAIVPSIYLFLNPQGLCMPNVSP